MQKKILFALFFGLVLGFAGNVFAAADENGHHIPNTPWVEGETYHVDCYGTGAYYVFAGNTHQCDGDNDIVLSQSPNNSQDSWNLDVYNFECNLDCYGQVVPYRNYAVNVISQVQWDNISQQQNISDALNPPGLYSVLAEQVGALLGFVIPIAVELYALYLVIIYIIKIFKYYSISNDSDRDLGDKAYQNYKENGGTYDRKTWDNAPHIFNDFNKENNL